MTMENEFDDFDTQIQSDEIAPPFDYFFDCSNFATNLCDLCHCCDDCTFFKKTRGNG